MMDESYCIPDSASSSDAYWLLLQVLSLIPLWHYLLLAAFLLLSVLYNFLQLHFFQDLFSGFPGSPVLLSYNTSSQIYHAVVSQCEVLRGRYFATPWLCSPNLQTLFLNYFGRPPLVKYARELFRTADGGTIALDWVFGSHVSDDVASEDESIPIVVVIPGLTSDSSSQGKICWGWRKKTPRCELGKTTFYPYSVGISLPAARSGLVVLLYYYPCPHSTS